jgi:type IV secretion system protein VirB10
VTLEALSPLETTAASGEGSTGFVLPGPVTLATGTQAKIVLLGRVSASKSRPGDSFQARLVEPVRLDSKVVLPEGTLLAGKVVKSTPPRMLSRAGSLLLTFTDVILPGRASIPAVASVTAVELDQRSHTKIDPEGKLQGDRPGKAWMAINIGVTAGIAKVTDDSMQLIIEAVVSTATDASTAGTARIVGICASGLFLLTRHGRDVVLPRFSEMNVSFDRPVSLPGSQSQSPKP